MDLMVEAPDFITATELVDRLKSHHACAMPSLDDACYVAVSDVPRHRMRDLLTTLRGWATEWELDPAIRVGGNTYSLRTRKPVARLPRKERVLCGSRGSDAAAAAARPACQPRLVFFYAPASGRCRRVEGFISQVLQHRQNHDTFSVVRVSVEREPNLAERFRVEEVPTICVVDGGTVRKRIVAPRGCRQLEAELAEWLR